MQTYSSIMYLNVLVNQIQKLKGKIQKVARFVVKREALHLSTYETNELPNSEPTTLNSKL